MNSAAPAGYEFIEDIAIADVAFRARAPDLGSLFFQCALATTAVMVDEPCSVVGRERRRVELTGGTDPEMLLFDFLQEIIYYKDAEGLLLLPEAVEITGTDRELSLWATLAGEAIDRERHPLNADVKAVTMHRFAVRRTGRGWEAEVVLDI